MKLEKYNPETAPAVAVKLDEKWLEVSKWVRDAANFQHASLACQVMAGFTLTELKEFYGQKPGRRTDLATSPSDLERLNWSDLVKEHAGVSDETARKWMMMADGVKSLWKKLPAREKLKALMSVPPSEWTADDSRLIADATHKITNGQTQLEFMMELGCCKKPSGNANPTSGPHKKLTLAEEVAAYQEKARVQWSAVDLGLSVYKDQFTLLTDSECEAQIARLEVALKARFAWLKQPQNLRDPKAIEALFNK